MPIVSTETMINTIAEQQAEIAELKGLVAQLELMLQRQSTRMLAQELGEMLIKYPEKLNNPIIASLNLH